jgi:RNase P/RNase MRP subunit p30
LKEKDKKVDYSKFSLEKFNYCIFRILYKSLFLFLFMIINEVSLEKAKMKVLACKERPLIVVAKDDKFNRGMIDFGRFDVLLSVEKGFRRGNLRQIDSGANHVLAKIATKKGIAFGIDFRELRELNEVEKIKSVSKMIQNFRVYRKAKSKVRVFCEKWQKKDVFCFLLSLGVSTKQAKEAIDF